MSLVFYVTQKGLNVHKARKGHCMVCKNTQKCLNVWKNKDKCHIILQKCKETSYIQHIYYNQEENH